MTGSARYAQRQTGPDLLQDLWALSALDRVPGELFECEGGQVPKLQEPRELGYQACRLHQVQSHVATDPEGWAEIWTGLENLLLAYCKSILNLRGMFHGSKFNKKSGREFFTK